MLSLREEMSYQSDEAGLTDNMLIFGENLIALQRLAADWRGKVKLIYIDPPYNTKQAFVHYDDNLTSSTWLDMMEERVRRLKELLSPDGSLWIQVDDNEVHYLKLLCDQIFGRKNFVTSVIWQRKTAPIGNARKLSRNHDHILVYAKKAQEWESALLPRTEHQKARYKHDDGDSRGVYCYNGLSTTDYGRKGHSSLTYPIKHPVKGTMMPPPNHTWSVSEKRYQELLERGDIVFTPTLVKRKRYLSEAKQGVSPLTLWTSAETGNTAQAKEEAVKFNASSAFATPKPERLLQRIIHLSTSPGDVVLDCFAGSGTAGAVAHKMGRRWIMIENGEQMHTHIIPRLQKVINGEDKAGVTEAVGWKGGGGFRYYTTFPTDQSVLQNASNSSMLWGQTQGQPKPIYPS